jgi:redox-sensitive bicupin YhaK (pirin superfamily)
MSWMLDGEPSCTKPDGSKAIELVIDGRKRDIEGLPVTRVLPVKERRMIGPFAFLDHMGPATFPAGKGVDVRPHPHINLATVTYLFEGELVHRDSLGSHQTVVPGDVNWMTAGRGIVHSERTGDELRKSGSTLHGIQLWVALPRAAEEAPPAFYSHLMETLPDFEEPGVRVRLLAGEAFGHAARVRTFSPMFYADLLMKDGGKFELEPQHPERAAYIAEGALRCGKKRYIAGQMLVFTSGQTALLRADKSARVMLLGGEPLDGPRHIWWNFVSSSKERIEQAKRDWNDGKFPKVPGDEAERVPLPIGM